MLEVPNYESYSLFFEDFRSHLIISFAHLFIVSIICVLVGKGKGLWGGAEGGGSFTTFVLFLLFFVKNFTNGINIRSGNAH